MSFVAEARGMFMERWQYIKRARGEKSEKRRERA